MPPAWQAKRSSAPVFMACNIRTSLSPSSAAAVRAKRPSAARSSIWPPAMPPRPEARASALTSSMRTRRIGMGLRPRQDVEGEGEQAVAGEDGGRLVEFPVRGRLAAPQLVIVHGRQIVMHQRVAMHAFERRARHQRVLPRHVEQGRAFDHQERPKPLAAAEARIAHGLEQPRRAAQFAVRRRCREEPIEERLGIGGHRIEAREKGCFCRSLRRHPAVPRPCGVLYSVLHLRDNDAARDSAKGNLWPTTS